MNPGGGALIAEGAMRDCLMCARDERIAIWMPCVEPRQRADPTESLMEMRTPYIQTLEVFVRDVDELLGPLCAFREVFVLRAVRLG